MNGGFLRLYGSESRGPPGGLEKNSYFSRYSGETFLALVAVREKSVSQLEDGMAHTFFRGVVFLSGLVSGRFFAIRGGNLLVSGLESSQGSWWSREGMVPDGKMACLDFQSGLIPGFFPE